MKDAQVGAAAFMGGATRMTLTTTVMVMETTGALQLIVPLMLTVFVAKVRPRAGGTRFPGRRGSVQTLDPRTRPWLLHLHEASSCIQARFQLTGSTTAELRVIALAWTPPGHAVLASHTFLVFWYFKVPQTGAAVSVGA